MYESNKSTRENERTDEIGHEIISRQLCDITCTISKNATQRFINILVCNALVA